MARATTARWRSMSLGCTRLNARVLLCKVSPGGSPNTSAAVAEDAVLGLEGPALAHRLLRLVHNAEVVRIDEPLHDLHIHGGAGGGETGDGEEALRPQYMIAVRLPYPNAEPRRVPRELQAPLALAQRVIGGGAVRTQAEAGGALTGE